MRARRVLREIEQRGSAEMFQLVVPSTSMTRSRTASSSELPRPGGAGAGAGAGADAASGVSPSASVVTSASDDSSATRSIRLCELADVPRPRVRAQRRARLGRQRLRRHAVVGARSAQIVLGEQQDVVAARAQGGSVSVRTARRW